MQHKLCVRLLLLFVGFYFRFRFDTGGVARGLEIYIPFSHIYAVPFVLVLLRVICDVSSYVSMSIYLYTFIYKYKPFHLSRCQYPHPPHLSIHPHTSPPTTYPAQSTEHRSRKGRPTIARLHLLHSPPAVEEQGQLINPRSGELVAMPSSPRRAPAALSKHVPCERRG